MNVVIYARFSCKRQTEQSIEGQLKICSTVKRQLWSNVRTLRTLFLQTQVSRTLTRTHGTLFHQKQNNPKLSVLLQWLSDYFFIQAVT